MKTFGGYAPFEILQPAQQRVPFLFISPHSGAVYPDEFLKQTKLDSLSIRLSEDAFVNQLFSGVVEKGAGLMFSNVPRAYVDLNRAPFELDQRLFKDKLPSHLVVRSPRVEVGLGTIPRIVALGRDIYDDVIRLDDAITRINDYYFPFHHALESLLTEIVTAFGYAVLIDCHSMPSDLNALGQSRQADFILGNRHGISCAYELTLAASEFLEQQGFNVVLNDPYQGGYISAHYGAPSLHKHALQIEINRSLYMDEALIKPTGNFATLQSILMQLADHLMSLPDHCFFSYQNAAE